MSSSQRLVLLDGVSGDTTGDSKHWAGGPLLMIVTKTAGPNVHVEINVDGSGNWAQLGSDLTFANGWRKSHLPPCQVRGRVTGSPSADNLSLIFQGYDEAASVPDLG